jgi:hypothetical protein
MPSRSSNDDVSGNQDTRESQAFTAADSLELLTTDRRPAHDHDTHQPMASEILSHSLSMSDPDNPMNWPLHREIHTSVCGYVSAASVYVVRGYCVVMASQD